jgi:hypothetical protein
VARCSIYYFRYWRQTSKRIARVREEVSGSYVLLFYQHFCSACNNNAVEKPAERVPLWQSTLSALSKPDYLPTVCLEWEYLRALGRSSLLDFDVYEGYRGGKGSLAAQNLSKVAQSYADIVARNEATFKSSIPVEWQNSDATKRYMNDLDYYSSLWHSTHV